MLPYTLVNELLFCLTLQSLLILQLLMLPYTLIDELFCLTLLSLLILQLLILPITLIDELFILPYTFITADFAVAYDVFHFNHN